MKRLFIALLILPLITVGLLMPFSKPASAASNNDLIDDSVFDNTNSMNAAQIDNWLNTYFPSSCISTNSGFSAPDPVGYSPNYPVADGRYLYGSAVSAGQVIYDAAVGHGLNPQVLITKLQNEEQLVDGSAGCGSTWRYASAVGYACTDSDTFTHNYTYTGGDPFSDSTVLATPIYYRNGVPVNSISGSCVNHNYYAGFSEQVAHAAWALSIWQHKSEGQTSWAAINGGWNHCDDINTCPPSMNIPAGWACYGGLMTQGNFKRCPTDSTTVFYDGYASIDGQTLHMDNGATAALYVYTPHIQSFATIFTNYFGSPTTPCEATTNVSGAKSGYKFLSLRSSSGTNLTFTLQNNTGSGCAEAHLWNAGYNSWAAHYATGMKDTDPAAGTFVNVGAPGSRVDNLAYILYSGAGGMVEVHKLSPNMQHFPGYYDVATNLSGVTASSGIFVSGDFFGRGYNQLAYILYSNGRNHAEVHMFDPTLSRAVGYYDVETNLTGVSANTGTFVAGDFLGRGYDQLAYVVYAGSTNTTEIHVFNPSMTSSTMYEVPTNLGTASPSTGAFVAGDFLGRGYDQLTYVAYTGSSGRVETHTFSPDLRRGVGFQDIITNLTGININQ